jgi:hypothetical protein
MKNFEMYTPKGDKACEKALNKILTAIKGPKFLEEGKLTKLVETELDKVAKKHPEVHDTEPRWHIYSAVTKALQERGYGYDFDF